MKSAKCNDTLELERRNISVSWMSPGVSDKVEMRVSAAHTCGERRGGGLGRGHDHPSAPILAHLLPFTIHSLNCLFLKPYPPPSTDAGLWSGAGKKWCFPPVRSQGIWGCGFGDKKHPILPSTKTAWASSVRLQDPLGPKPHLFFISWQSQES